MSDEHNQPHSAIRTFAQDLAQAREKRGQSTTDGSLPVPNEKTAVEKNIPKENFKAQAPRETKKTPTITVTQKNTEIPKISTPSTSTTINKKSHTQPSLQAVMDDITEDKAVKEKKKQPVKVRKKVQVQKEDLRKRANIGYDAAIITDNKNKRFSLTRAIGESLTSWFKSFSFSKKKNSPVYTVPDTQRRKGVIQKATSKSGSVFTADSAELKAKIKQRQESAAAKKEATESASELNWSPYTNTGYALLEEAKKSDSAAKPQNVTMEFKHLAEKATVQSPLATKSQVDKDLPQQNTVSTTEAIVDNTQDTELSDTRWSTPEAPVASTIPSKPTTEPLSTPVPKAQPAAKPLAEEITQPKKSPSPKKLKEDSGQSAITRLESLNTNTLAISIVAVLSITVVVFFVGRAFLEYITTVEPVVNPDTTSYLMTATANPVVINQLNSSTDIPLRAGELLNVDYVDTQLFTANGEVISPANIIHALDFSVSASFAQALTDIRFAQKNKSQPIIIFEFLDADTALGGFLNWEDNMAQDLRELYLITQTSDSVFVDRNIAGTDVRVLQSATGETLAVYGIVSTNTAIVTSSVETFKQVLKASFNN